MVFISKNRRGLSIAISIVVLLSLSVVPYLAILSANANTSNAMRRAYQSASIFLRTSSVVEAYDDSSPTTGPALDGCYDIAHYYMDTYTSDTMKASRFCSKYTAINYWKTNPRHAYICSHGGTVGDTPYIAFSTGSYYLYPADIIVYVPFGDMEDTDAMFLSSCYGLANYNPINPASKSFGRTFCEHCGVNNVIGCPVPLAAPAAILVTAYYYHFRLVYGYNAYTAINLARQHTLAFLALAAVLWPVSIGLALIWLNAGLGISIPTIVANIVMFVLFLFPVFAMIAAFSTLTILLVDENYY